MKRKMFPLQVELQAISSLTTSQNFQVCVFVQKQLTSVLMDIKSVENMANEVFLY